MNQRFRKYIIICFCLLFATAIFAQSGIYVGGHFRRDSLITVSALKNSGFTYVILFNVQVEANGNLTMDNALLCSNGVYTFAARHPKYVSDVTALRTGLSSVQRVEKCIGGWGSKSYDNIKALVKAEGTGENSILYRNFKALKEAIPVIEAINNDDEHTYDVETASAFHIMLSDLGYKTTIAPYMNKTFWQNFVTRVNNVRPGAVDRIDLQCYDGGAGNKSNPNAWAMGNIPLHAGLLHFESSANINTQMKTWKNTSSVVGGFLWVYNANDFNLQSHSKAITSVFGGGEVVFMSKMRPQVKVFPQPNFLGEAVNFEVGKFSTYGIASQKFRPADLSSIKIHEGFTMEVFEKDSLKGKSVLFDNDIADMSEAGIDAVSSWRILANGDRSLAGKTFYLKNRMSGMYLSLEAENMAEGVAMVQKEYTGASSQKWEFKHLYNGTYTITNQYSKKTVQLRDFSESEGDILEQGVYRQQANQRNIAIKTSTQDEYKILLEHSVKYIAVESGKENLTGAKITQVESATNESAYWILEDASLSGVSNILKNKQVTYPNPAENQLFISSDIQNISQVVINDMHGRRIYMGNAVDNVLDVSSLPQGMYFVHISIDGTTEAFVSRFVKR